MANNYFRGDAQPVAQLETITVGGTWSAGETATIMINGKTATHTVVSGSTSVSDVVAGLLTAITNALAGEFDELTWANADPDITATANTAGVPHTITVSEASASGTISTVTTTAAAGPAFMAANNVEGGLPGGGDILILEQTSQDILYGMNALNGVAYDELHIYSTYTGAIGLPMRNSDTSPDYWEYRDRLLQTEAPVAIIGIGEGDGSGRMNLDFNATNMAIEVLNTATATDDGQQALQIVDTGATSTLEITGKSSVGLGTEEGAATRFSTIDISENASLTIHSSVTVGTLRISGNAQVDLDNDSANTDITLIEVRGNGKLTIRGDNDITTLTILGTATVTDLGTGTITNLNRGPEGTYTNNDSPAAPGDRIITNCTLEHGAGTLHTRGVTFTNGIALGKSTLIDHPNLDPGYDLTIEF